MLNMTGLTLLTNLTLSCAHTLRLKSEVVLTPFQQDRRSEDIAPSSTGSANPKSENQAKMVNIYFLILAILILVIGAFVWWWRWSKKKKELTEDWLRRVELAEDIEMGRRSGGLSGVPGGRLQVQIEEEGVDGEGLAPPPYVTEVAFPERAHIEGDGGVLPKYEDLEDRVGGGASAML